MGKTFHKGKKRVNNNHPSKVYGEYGLYDEQGIGRDEAYCHGHKSFGKTHRKVSRILRARMKEQLMEDYLSCLQD